MDLSKKVLKLLSESNLSQRQLAKLAGISQSVVSKYASGERGSCPDYNILRKLMAAAKRLGSTINFLSED